jgi:hypothetical protein
MTKQLQKAYLEVETGGKIECMFNPATFTFQTRAKWKTHRASAMAVAPGGRSR